MINDRNPLKIHITSGFGGKKATRAQEFTAFCVTSYEREVDSTHIWLVLKLHSLKNTIKIKPPWRFGCFGFGMFLWWEKSWKISVGEGRE